MKEDKEAKLLHECNNFIPKINRKSKKMNEALFKNLSPHGSKISNINKNNFGNGEENVSNGSNEFENDSEYLASHATQ